jgi:hypothetical protein
MVRSREVLMANVAVSDAEHRAETRIDTAAVPDNSQITRASMDRV